MRTNWEVKTLGDLCEVVTKGTTPTSIGHNFTNSGINFVKIESIDSNRNFLPSKFATINEECHQALRRSQLKKGDILFSIAGAIGRTAIVSESILPANTNQALAIIRLKPSSDACHDFVLLTLESNIILDQINKLKGGAAQQNLSLEQVRSFPIPLPLLDEQKRIVAILNEVFAAIDKAKANAETNLQNARALFESYLQSVFANPGEGWEEKSLGELCERITKGSSPTWQGVKYVENHGVLFVTSENVGERELLLSKRKYVEAKFNIIEKKSILKKGDVLTNIVGASIGRTAIFDLDEIANINQAVCILRCNPELLNNRFLSYLLNSPFFRSHLHENEVNNARANLSLSFFSALRIPLPLLEEQAEIIAKLDALSVETKKLEAIYQQKLVDLAELKKSILQKAFQGELTVAVS